LAPAATPMKAYMTAGRLAGGGGAPPPTLSPLPPLPAPPPLPLPSPPPAGAMSGSSEVIRQSGLRAPGRRNLPNEALVLAGGERVEALRYLGTYEGGRTGAVAVTPAAASAAAGAGAGAADAAAPAPAVRASCACHLPATREERLRLRGTPGVCKAFERRRLLPSTCLHTADTNSGWHGAYGRLWPGACGGTLLTALALPSKGGAVTDPPGSDPLGSDPCRAARRRGGARPEGRAAARRLPTAATRRPSHRKYTDGNDLSFCFEC
jgi:hypothetical protein